MSRTYGRHACGRDCIVCQYTPARNVREELASESVAELVEEFARDRDHDICPNYCGDYCRCFEDDEVHEMLSHDEPLTVSFLELAKVA